jgi:glycyl-tRNA synthetase
MADVNVMEQIVSLCKRRGFVYPASEIYGGINGFWDYGPLGAQLKNNIRDWWWRCMVECPPIGPDGHPLEMVGLDSAIIQHPKTWEASGHVGGFNDPMVDDTETKQRFRADHAIGVWLHRLDDSANHDSQKETAIRRIREEIPNFTVLNADAQTMFEELCKLKGWRKNKVSIKNEDLQGNEHDSIFYEVDAGGAAFFVFFALLDSSLLRERHAEIPSPFTGKAGTLTEPRMFNLMFETYVGAIRDENAKAYLRPETAQGIFLNYKNVLDTMRVKMPFGIAQIGKSFRNEVTPRNFIFRSREFEQMEMEWFCPPEESAKWYEFWKDRRMAWWKSLGIDEGNLRFRDHDPDELAHYSKMCVDIEYKYPFTAPDFGELEGIAHRGCFDLTQHQEHSGQKMDYFDQDRQRELQDQGLDKDEIKQRSRYIPNVIEPASGLTRAVLVLLCEAFTPDPDRPSKVYMKFHPKFAPVKAAVLPLVAKDGMPEIAEQLYYDLREKHIVELDVKQNIGKRYARQDEIGTPFCFTIDGQTKEDNTVTVRHRDTLEQQRIALEQVGNFLDDKMQAAR